MSNTIPLPEPATPLPMEKKLWYSADQMHAHAAAVSAAKDAEIARLRAELDARRKSGSASDRLHNICAAVEAEAGSSVFSREEWDRIDAENVALRAALRGLQSRLAASLRIPTLPWPDPGAHSHEATGRAIHASFCELRFVVINVLSAARAALGDKNG